MYSLDNLQGFPKVLRMDQGGRGVDVLYDLPLLLAARGTKPILQYKPKGCICQEPLSLCHTPWENCSSSTGRRWPWFSRSPPVFCGVEQGEV